MFKRIISIKNLGVFDEFSGTGLPEFAPFNILYGWNYSGKTTLSRLFRSLELGTNHPDYPHAMFSVEHKDGRCFDHNFAVPCNVRVYNEDFRRDNLRWDDSAGIEPILLLGSEEISKRDQIRQKTQKLEDLRKDMHDVEEMLRTTETIISRAETECARQISKELNLIRFDKRHLKHIIGAWGDSIPQPLDDAEFQIERKKVTEDEKDELPDLNIRLDGIDDTWRAARDLLQVKVGFAGTIARLVERPDVGHWVEGGLQFHRDATHCEFCESPLSAGRIAALNAHFSDEFAKLKERIGESIKSLSSRKLILDGSAYGRKEFYADLHPAHAELGDQLRHSRDNFNGSIDQLVTVLKTKLDNPFETIDNDAKPPDAGSLTDAAERFQELIDRNNVRTRRFVATRKEAIEALKVHYAADAMLKINLAQLRNDIQLFQKKKTHIQNTLSQLVQEIDALRLDASNASRGAVAVNDALVRFFGKGDIRIAATDDGHFRLMRGEHLARNLSEGERTAIAFCYFISKLLENGNQLAHTIVYIDDPISSLDSRHLLHINAFIKATFYNFDSNSNPKHQCLAKQVFISTHNYDFFHLTFDWMRHLKDDMYSSYLVERADTSGRIASRVAACPDSITKYRSEYLFLFHQLSSYVTHPTNDAQTIFNIGNMARRFVEGYLAFKLLESSNIDSSISLLILDPVSAERARKFMHYYSHTISRSGGMQVPDMSEAREILQVILDSIKKHDPVHYCSAT